jgi:hypothetical protein
MTLVVLALALAGLLLIGLTLICVVLSSRLVKLEERVAWLEGPAEAEDEASSRPEGDIPDILKVGATQPPGSA